MLGKHIARCEDSLTAVVFTHLLHLPSEVFWRILRNACYTTHLPENPGEPLQVDAWPKWGPTGTGNHSYVEPDVFMRFSDFHLIIEAKRWDDGQQNPEQWRRELIAYANEYGEKPVRMIALGGIWTTDDEEVIASAEAERPELRCPVHMCRWERLLGECQRMRKEILGLKFRSSQTQAHQRVLADVIDLFGWHGFQTGIWYAEVAAELPRFSMLIESHHQTFESFQHLRQ
jgi:hypothetical protein